jgi:molybdate transport system ATP-binding protein
LRNVIEGVIEDIADDDEHAALVRVDIGGEIVLSRVTHAAVEALQLQRRMRVWVLIKAVSLRGHTVMRATSPAL